VTPPAEIVSQDEIEKAADKAQDEYDNPRYSEIGATDLATSSFEDGFKLGANFALAAAAEHSKRAMVEAKIEALERLIADVHSHYTWPKWSTVRADIEDELARLRAQVAP
jgi:hypothetical protein